MNTPDTGPALDLDAIKRLVKFGKLDWFCASCGTARDCHASLPHKWMPKDTWALADALEITAAEVRRLREETASHDVCANSRDCIMCAERTLPAGAICFSCHTAAFSTLREENERLREAVAHVEAHCTENAHPGVMHHSGGLNITGDVVFADTVLAKLRGEQPRATARR